MMEMIKHVRHKKKKQTIKHNTNKIKNSELQTSSGFCRDVAG